LYSTTPACLPSRTLRYTHIPYLLSDIPFFCDVLVYRIVRI
jgi:hypothetical protein